MKSRCRCPGSKSWGDYGGRGISYDPSWEKFENFWKDMGDTWQKGLSLDRIDNNGNYCKENCKWSTKIEQNNNKRTNVCLTHDGVTNTVTGWARELRIPHTLIRSKLKRGLSIQQIIESAAKEPVA